MPFSLLSDFTFIGWWSVNLKNNNVADRVMKFEFTWRIQKLSRVNKFIMNEIFYAEKANFTLTVACAVNIQGLNWFWNIESTGYTVNIYLTEQHRYSNDESLGCSSQQAVEKPFTLKVSRTADVKSWVVVSSSTTGSRRTLCPKVPRRADCEILGRRIHSQSYRRHCD